MALRTMGEFFDAAKLPIENLGKYVTRHILYDHATLDHICYKCGSRQEFVFLRELFEHEGCSFWNSRISGRSIAYIKLHVPIKTVLGEINYLELQDQKPDGSQEPGFAHVEACPMGMSYEELIAYIGADHVIGTGHEHHETHDFEISDGFIFRCTREPLIEKIRRDEM